MPPLFSRAGHGALLALFVLLSACRDDPSPAPEGRASQVPASDKPASTSAPTPTQRPAAPAKPTLVPPPPRASAAPAPSASAAVVEPPALPPDPSLDCDVVLTPEDIKAACGVDVDVDAKNPTEDIGAAEHTCSRRWNSKDAGTLSVSVARLGSDAEAKERFKDIEGEVSGIESVSGLGDLARRFVKKGAGGHPIYHVEVVKGRFNVQVYNPKITLGPTTVGPVCDHAGLEKLLAKAITRLP